jgi:hypothetical protein
MSNNGNIWSGSIAHEIAAVLLEPRESAVSTEYPSKPERVQKRSAIELIIGEYKSPENSIIRIQQKDNNIYWKMDNNNPQKLKNENDNLYYWETNKDLKVAFTISQNSDNQVVDLLITMNRVKGLRFKKIKN